ncbi:MAG: cytochrome b5-like heme/steroid binding domain-containing protein [Myxococcota bacterium]
MGLSRWVRGLFRRAPEAAPLPKAEARDYALSELTRFDGSDPTRPLLIAIRGRVYDVTRGRDFYGPGGPYGMFAGKDCTRALAKMSFDEADFTASEEGLDDSERDQLEDWIETFEGKYGSIGALVGE